AERSAAVVRRARGHDARARARRVRHSRRAGAHQDVGDGKEARLMKSDRLQFYFDFVSHNAFLAWTGIHELAARHGRHVEAVPVLFAAMLEANGQRGPAEIPAKSAWMIRDVLW